MRVTFDRTANVAYIYLATFEEPKGQVAKTESVAPAHVQGTVNLDFDKHGRLLGIEVLGATRLLPYESLEEAEWL